MRRARSPAQSQPGRPQRREATRARVGRERRPVHEHGPGHDRQAPPQTRRPNGHPNIPRYRVSHRKHPERIWLQQRRLNAATIRGRRRLRADWQPRTGAPRTTAARRWATPPPAAQTIHGVDDPLLLARSAVRQKGAAQSRLPGNLRDSKGRCQPPSQAVALVANSRPSWFASATRSPAPAWARSQLDETRRVRLGCVRAPVAWARPDEGHRRRAMLDALFRVNPLVTTLAALASYPPPSARS